MTNVKGFLRQYTRFPWVLVLAAPLLIGPSLKAGEEHPFNISPELHQTIDKGMNQLFNLEFEEALQTFEGVQDKAQEHSMISFGVASCHWWRLSVYVLEGDEKESEPFLKAVKKCLMDSQALIDRGDPTGEGHLTYGGALGLWGRWEATNRNWFSAYFKGKKAYRYLKKALKKNPRLKDANMGLGIFDYYVATLPAVVRIFAFLGMGGDASVGLTELHIAANESQYARIPSKLFLSDIYANLENKPLKALEIVSALREEYPKSAFIHMLQIIALYNHGNIDHLEESAQEFYSFTQSGTYKSEFKVQGDFSLGITYFKKKNWEKADEYLTHGIETGHSMDPFHTWSYLYRGYTRDVLGKREEAVLDYKTVLAKMRRWGSHDNAKKRLKKPFTPKGEELDKLKL